MEFFREEMARDTDIRVEAMKNVIVIAAVLGPEKARTELVPFLHCACTRYFLAEAILRTRSVYMCICLWVCIRQQTMLCCAVICFHALMLNRSLLR
jgi:hypothetical protein